MRAAWQSAASARTAWKPCTPTNAKGLLEGKTETPPVGSPGNPRTTTYSYHPSGKLEKVVTPDGVTLRENGVASLVSDCSIMLRSETN